MATAASATYTFDFKNATGSYDAAAYQSFNLASTTDKNYQVTVYGGHLDSIGGGYSKTEGAEAKVWSGAGLGVSYAGSKDSPNDGTHQIDNAGGGSDFVVLDFSDKVTLSQINRAHYSGSGTGSGTDVSYLAYSGTLQSIMSGLDESGFSNLNAPYTSTGSKAASNIWIVAANVFGQTDDGFKLTSFTVSTPSAGSVPEPATWAMMMVGMGTVGFGLRRRRNGMAFAA